MKKHWRVLAIPLLLVVVMIISSITLAEGDPDLPIEMTRELNGAAYKIRVPADWNGTVQGDRSHAPPKMLEWLKRVRGY